MRTCFSPSAFTIESVLKKESASGEKNQYLSEVLLREGEGKGNSAAKAAFMASRGLSHHHQPRAGVVGEVLVLSADSIVVLRFS